MPDSFYYYLGAYFIIAIIGLVVQEREYLKTKYEERKIRKQQKKGGHHHEEEIEESKDDEEQKPLI
jgi:hypothetical protein